MGFFYAQTQNDAEKAKKQALAYSNQMPVQTLRKMGCAACPRNRDFSLKNPKLEKTGPNRPSVVILGPSPTLEDDRYGEYMSDRMHDILFSKFPRQTFIRDAAMLGLTQCAGGESATDVEIECCRNRVLSVIEKLKPKVVLTLGKTALHWATGLSGGYSLRGGRRIPTWFGSHATWVVSLPDSDWSFLKNRYQGKSSIFKSLYDDEVHNLLISLDKDAIAPPVIPTPGEYKSGLSVITGNDGDHDLLELRAALEWAATQPIVGLDYETNALRPYKVPAPTIYCAAVGTRDKSFSFSLDMPDGWPTDRHRKQAWTLYSNFLLDSNKKVAHNLGMEHIWTQHFLGNDILRGTEWEDTMAQAHTLDERRGTKSLNDCVRMHLGFFPKELSNVDPVRFLEYPIEKRLEYNALDCKWTHALYLKQDQQIKRNPDYLREYNRKVTLAPTLVLLEVLGLPCDVQLAQKMRDGLKTRELDLLSEIEKCPEVIKYVKRFGKFEPTSPSQVTMLYRDICGRNEVLKIDNEGRTSDSSAEDVLSQLPIDECPSAPLILEKRGMDKLEGTYLTPIIEKRIVHSDGCMHPIYNSMEAVTGRLSSEDPNGQNWPARKNKEVRAIVKAEPEHIVVASDYGQIEARVIAMASEDGALVEALWTKYDIHGHWYKRIMSTCPKWVDWLVAEFDMKNKPEHEIHKIGRQEAKNKWVFPQFYGASHKTCADGLHIPHDRAGKLMHEFWDEFHGVKTWQDKLITKYEKNFYVETLTGRRRRGALTKNKIINTPIQGTAADIVTAAMNELSVYAVQHRMDYHPRLNVHDDLTSMPLGKDVDDYIKVSTHIMCKHRFNFINVPLIVEVKTGPNWYDLKMQGEYRSDELFNIRNPFRK